MAIQSNAYNPNDKLPTHSGLFTSAFTEWFTGVNPDHIVCRAGRSGCGADEVEDVGARMITAIDCCILRTDSDLIREFLIHLINSKNFWLLRIHLYQAQRDNEFSGQILNPF